MADEGNEWGDKILSDNGIFTTLIVAFEKNPICKISLFMWHSHLESFRNFSFIGFILPRNSNMFKLIILMVVNHENT